jgi:hypothetical protein
MVYMSDDSDVSYLLRHITNNFHKKTGRQEGQLT